MNYKYKASIILVNYNGVKYNENLLNSLECLNTDKSLFEVIYLDNNSVDNSVANVTAYAKTSKLNLKIVKSDKNRGFAGGNNYAAKYAEGEFIVLLNNDTKVDSEWLNELVNMIESDASIGIVNSKLLFFYDFIRFEVNSVDGFHIENEIKINGKKVKVDPKFTDLVLHETKKQKALCYNGATIFVPLLDGLSDYEIEFNVLNNTDTYDYFSVDFDLTHAEKGKNVFHLTKKNVEALKETLIQNAGSKINEYNDGEDIGFGKVDSEKYSKAYEIDSACGASFIISHKDWDVLGGFDERFFMYYEDSDLSYRMKKLNKKLMFCPTSIVRHVHTGSSTEWSKFFLYHVIRNKLLFIYKNIGMETFEKEYGHVICSAIRERYRASVRIRAALDAKKIINGKTDIHF